MTIGLLLITHNDIGAQLLLAAKSTYGSIPIRTEVLSIDHYDQPSDLTKLTKQYIKLLDQGNGVLILTDMFGSTPSNIGKEFSHLKSVNIVSGINLSMLLHIFNYPKFNLKELTAKAIEGGKNGVIQIKNERKKVIISNKLGLHARAAAKIVTLTNKFQSIIEIVNNGKKADAKSIMKILMLAAPKGTEVTITASGKDEIAAIKSLEKLIEAKFDEES